MMRSGRLKLEAVVRLYPHLTLENHDGVLKQADGATRQEVTALVAALAPEPPPVRDIITPVSATRSPISGDVVVVEHRIHFTADDELVRMIARLKPLLRHKFPHGRIESIFKEAAANLLDSLERRRSPAKRKPLSNKGTVPIDQRRGGRRVPRPIKREVWSRDQGRYTFRAEDGTICGSREALEYDHIVAWADGGRSDAVENIRLLCRAHNQRLGRRRFGARRAP